MAARPAGPNELDIGIDVGGEIGFARMVYFTVEELAFFAALGVALGVSAYPVSDEDDVETAG